MKSENVNEATYTGKVVVSRKGGKLGAVLIDPKTGKPIPGSWRPEKEVPGGIPQANKSAFFKKEAEKIRSAEKDRLSKIDGGSKPPAAPPPRPSSTPPAAPAPAPARPSGPSGTTPAPAPAAPKPSPVAAYMKAAADARKSGDPAQMAKVRDMGMDIWRKSNPKLAAAADERARIRGTAQTDNPLMKDMRGGLSLTPSVQAPAVKNLGSGQQSLSQNPNAAIAATPKPQVPPVTASKDATMNKTADELSKNPLKKQEVKKEAYDIVLDYLLSEGHADTLSEAHYVMLQMDAEHIQNIVEAQHRVLAQRTVNGVTQTGYVTVDKKREGGFLGIGGKEVSKPVANTFIQRNISSRDAGRYNVQIDKKYGTGTGSNAMPATRVQLRARNQGDSGYMRVANPQALPNTGIPDRATPQRAGDQNRALDLYRPNVAVDNRPAAKPAAKPDAKPAAKPKITMTDAEFDKKYAWAMNPSNEKPATPRPSTRPAAKPVATTPKPKPQPPTIQSKNVTSTGTSYERRTPTSAELAAAKAAGGGEAGIKAAVDVAKTNKVAATSPTPDLKPEAPKKRESLAAQVKDLQTMRKAAEERKK